MAAAFIGTGHRAVAAKQRGHVDGKTRIAHPAAETRDMRADARHLGHDDHGRARAGHVHLFGHAIERDLARGEIFEGDRLRSCCVCCRKGGHRLLSVLGKPALGAAVGKLRVSV
jgi:hypothetical protein